MKKFLSMAKKIILGIVCTVISVFWLLYAVGFMLPLWDSDPLSKDYEEDMFFVPIGIFMALIWLICLAVFIIRMRCRKNSVEQEESLQIED